MWKFRFIIYDATGNYLFHGIVNNSTEVGDSRIDTHMAIYKLRDYYKAVYNPQTRIYGTNIRNSIF
jgi:hypothetical protein